jgi:DNA-binding transcriptional LysR family regulator
LLNRTTRSLSLTEPGSIYLESCRRILNEVDEADAQVRESSGTIQGHLRLVAASTVGLDLLAPRLIDYRRIHPRVTIELDLADHPLDMVERGYDLGVTPRLFDVPATMVARTLFEPPIILCASPDYLRESGMPSTPDDLSRHSCLNFSHETVSRAWQLQGPKGTVATSVNTVLQSNSPDVLLIAARSGLGICITGETLIANDLKCNRLVRVLPDYDLGRLEIILVYPSRKFVSAKVRSMIDFLLGLSVGVSRDG